MEDTCVVCGEYVPEGRMVCYKCEHQSGISVFDKYNIMLDNYKQGRISQKKWYEFCENCLNNLMDSNSSISEHLKDLKWEYQK